MVLFNITALSASGLFSGTRTGASHRLLRTIVAKVEMSRFEIIACKVLLIVGKGVVGFRLEFSKQKWFGKTSFVVL